MPGGMLTYARPGMAGTSAARGVASPTQTMFARPPATAPAPGGVRSANPGNQPPLAGPKQAPTKPPEEYTDTLGNVFRWNAGGFTGGTPGTAGLSAGEWTNIGNVNRGAGSTPDNGPDLDLDALLARAKGAMPGAAPPAVLPPRIGHPGEPDRRRAESLEFGRAKDRIGKLGGGAMRALRNELQTRGIAGSDYGDDRAASIIAQQQGDLAGVITDQAKLALDRDQHATDRDYAGDVGQRTTDVGFNTTTRGQDMDYEIARANNMRDLLSFFASARRRAY